MMVWRLWRAWWLSDRRHPVYARYRALSLGRQARPREALVWLALLIAPMLSMIVVPALAWLYPLFLMALVFFGATLTGLLWSQQSAHRVARMRQTGTLDLLRLTPGGGLDGLWRAIIGTLDHQDGPRQLYRIVRAALSLIAGALMLLVGGLLVTESVYRPEMLGSTSLETLLFGLGLLTLMVAYALDYPLSGLMALLCGLGAGLMVRGADEARWIAPAAFLLLQGLVYGTLFLVALLILALLGGTQMVFLALGLAALVLLSLTRELLVRWLTGEIAYHMNIPLADWRELTSDAQR